MENDFHEQNIDKRTKVNKDQDFCFEWFDKEPLRNFHERFVQGRISNQFWCAVLLIQSF